MSHKLQLSASPHIHTKSSTGKIMLDVIIALLPAFIAGTLLFGARAALVVATCIAVSVLSEALFNIIVKKEQTIGDLSAVVTGLLLGLNLPANIPLWQAAVGAVFAIVIVKCSFGGLGCNMVNPAITARVFMVISFGAMATTAFPVDTVAGPTPLAVIDRSVMPQLDVLFWGKIGGTIGETCVPALLIGFIYLLVRKVITWHLPVTYILTSYLFTLAVFDGNAMMALADIMSGGLLLGAIFMATDYVTSPSTPWGKVIFGVGAGIITVVIRIWGIYPEGVSFAILLMNILNPYIEKWSALKVFGGKKA
ncbi:MAG: RnfABCDGE type electron transport complex subunit D [Clostridia bacterium]|nr:RnfABCDGE type electron transport complex subunit D [Clostridia bacterium]